MAEILALGAAARLAVAAFSAVAAERDIAPELRALQLRVLAAASSVEAAGEAAFDRDERVAPLLRTLAEAMAWVERREAKAETQYWLHRAIMSDTTKAEIVRLDNELTKHASTYTYPRARRREHASRAGDNKATLPHAQCGPARAHFPRFPAARPRSRSRGARRSAPASLRSYERIP